MSEASETIARQWPSRTCSVTFKPSRSQIDRLLIDAGRDPRKDFDRYLDDVNECLARLYGREFTFALVVSWVYCRSDLDVIGDNKALSLEVDKLDQVARTCTTDVLRELVRQVLAGSHPEKIEGNVFEVTATVPVTLKLGRTRPRARSIKSKGPTAHQASD